MSCPRSLTKQTMNTKYLFAAIMIWLLAACKKDDDKEIILDKIKITETVSPGGLRVTLWADRSQLTVGYNPVYLTLADASGEIRNKTITLHPEMDMHTMQHSSPVEQPVYDVSQGLYTGAVVFTMPSGDMGAWKLTVDAEGQLVDLDVVVADAPANTRPVGTYMGTDKERYSISLVQPLIPKTGLNELEILINRRADMHNFPAVTDFSVEFRPEMPSMGHGSPNNTAPVSVGYGRYRGKVNFTMTGDWRLYFTLKRNGAVVVEDAYLDILF